MLNDKSGLAAFWQPLWSRISVGRLEELNDSADLVALLAHVQRRMFGATASDREHAVQVFTLKHKLQKEVKNAERHITELRTSADEASRGGPPDLVARLREEALTCEQALVARRDRLDQTVQITVEIKRAITRNEQRIRQKTADKLARSQWFR